MDLAAELSRLQPRLILVDSLGTLVLRNVPSDRVRELASADLAALLGTPRRVAELVKLRRRLERQLSAEVSEPPIVRDFRHVDLARAMHAHLPDSGVDGDEFCRLFCAIELAIEMSITTPNTPIIDALAGAARRAVVRVVSDTNLSTSMMRTLLAHHGIDDIVDDVIVSCDAGETKRSGKLYRLAITDEERDHHPIVMIGDNPIADGARAEQAGLRSLLVSGGPWDAVKVASTRALRRSTRRRLRDALAPADADDVFPELALTLWLFMSRLDASLRAAGAPRAVFLAREGAFLQRVFDRLARVLTARGLAPIETSYLLTSRKSTFVTALADVDTELQSFLRAFPATTMEDLSRLLSVPLPHLPAAPSGAAGRAATNLEAILAAPGVRAAIADRREAQATLLRELLAVVAPEPGPLHTVDVGWKATVRDHLAVVLSPRPVHAHLLGLIVGTAGAGDAHKTGHLFSNRPERSEHFQLFSHFKELYELLLAGPHGSVGSYARDDAGSVRAVLDDDDDERRVHELVVGPFQDRCAERFSTLTTVLATERGVDRWLFDEVAAHHGRMMYRPTDAELDVVGRLAQYENFGPAARRRVPGHAAPAAAGGSIRRHIAGGGWPPLRMRHGGANWQRWPYGALKTAQLRRRP